MSTEDELAMVHKAMDQRYDDSDGTQDRGVEIDPLKLGGGPRSIEWDSPLGRKFGLDKSEVTRLYEEMPWIQRLDDDKEDDPELSRTEPHPDDLKYLREQKGNAKDFVEHHFIQKYGADKLPNIDYPGY